MAALMSVDPGLHDRSVSSYAKGLEPAWLRLAAEAASVGFWHLDLETEIIECTPRCKASLGIPQDTKIVTLDIVWQVVHADDRERVRARVQQAITTKGSYAVEYRVIWPDGSVHWIASRGRSVEIAGRPGMVGSTIDDTERRRVEELNRLITTHVAEGLCFMDEKGRLTYMNPAASEILGYSEDELRGKDVHTAVHESHPTADCPLSQTLFEGKIVSDHEELWLHKNGQMISLICSATPIVQEGRVAGAVLSLHDITDRKRMENALRDASRARDEFLATVSHELRTPMTSILGWAQLMKVMNIDSELRVAVEQIEMSAKAQAAIVDDLIDISRAITGKLRLHIDTVDVINVLDEALRFVETTIAAKRIEIRKTIDCDDPLLKADRGRLHQIFWNLLSNAIKFTPEGGRVSVDLECTAERLTATVSDTGIGIPAEFLPSVFDRFSQQVSSESRQHGGLGLGLAIVKQLVEMHGGTVSAHSEGVGKGATFVVVLPRR
jgi:PAS domain S-box-containing protein